MTDKSHFESFLDTKPQHVRLVGTSPLKKGQFTEQTEAGMSAIQMQTVLALWNVKHVYNFGSLLALARRLPVKTFAYTTWRSA